LNNSIVAERADDSRDVTRNWRELKLDIDFRRLLTTVADRKARTEYCRLFLQEYPGDPEHGCPADKPPPATIVTAQGDIPLLGAWLQ
jgi:hypothetical protein